MEEKYHQLLRDKCSNQSYQKLIDLGTPSLLEFIGKYVELCKPISVYVCDDSQRDREYITNKAIECGEEIPLKIKGHTVHFDGYYDQARDKKNTRYLLSKGMYLGESFNTIEKEVGIREIHSFFENSMQGREMFVLFFCLGPTDSEFSIPCVQITDSSYVAHSEYILYRPGYRQFKKFSSSRGFFKYVHSAGELKNGVSKNIEKRRIYIDLEENTVYSVNTQYGGNTIGLKKLSLRLAIRKADKEGWLAEHMLIMGVRGPKGRKTYFTGAFPSACGKTSTAMLPGESIVGDDIAYLRKKDGKVYAANVECGIFGIIRDVNPKDDPIIWEVLNSPGEVIFSNILITKEGIPFWLGDGRPTPSKGINYSGQWYLGKKDAQGREILYAHKNARYTVSLYALKNVDSELDNPQGVEIKGIIYGGRDSCIWPPVQESFNWVHGVITMGASLESETTSATLGKEGVREFNPMSNIDFLSIPLGRYIENHIKFTEGISNPPIIFAVNYFLKGENGKYLTAMEDKRVWIKWMELRVNKDIEAIETPTGYIPKYQDLKRLFKEILNKDYSYQDYLQQFTLRVPENLDKIERILQIYKTEVEDTPAVLWEVLLAQQERLREAQKRYGDYISPGKWESKKDNRK